MTGFRRLEFDAEPSIHRRDPLAASTDLSAGTSDGVCATPKPDGEQSLFFWFAPTKPNPGTHDNDGYKGCKCLDKRQPFFAG